MKIFLKFVRLFIVFIQIKRNQVARWNASRNLLACIELLFFAEEEFPSLSSVVSVDILYGLLSLPFVRMFLQLVLNAELPS